MTSRFYSPFSVLLTFVVLILCEKTQAQTTRWSNTGVGDWNTPSNWDNGLPNSGSDVFVDANGTAMVTTNALYNSLSIGLGSVGPGPGRGTLIINNGGNLSGATARVGLAVDNCVVIVNNGGTWTNTGLIQIPGNSFASVTINGGLVDAGSVRVGLGGSASGSFLTLNGGVLLTNSVFASPTFPDFGLFNFAGGTLQAKSSNPNFVSQFASGRGTFSLTGPTDGTIDTQSFQVGITSPITGIGGLIKMGVGTLTFTANNTYTGTTTINAGVLALGANNAFSPASNVFMAASGTMDLSGFSGTIAALSGAAGALVTNSGAATTGTLSLGNMDRNGNFSGIIQNGAGTLALTKVGTGTQTLSGVSTYSGSTTIAAGTLAQGAANAFSPNSDVSVANSSTLDLGGFSGIIGALSGATGSLVTNTGAAATLSVGQTNNSGTFAGTIQNGAGTLALTKVGTGTQTLSGVSTYSGTTTIAAGTLAQGAANAFSPNSDVSVANSSTLDLGGFSGIIGALSGATGSLVTNTGAAATLSVGQTNNSGTFAGTIQDGAGTLALTKVGTGAQTLTGTSTYTGGTTITSGTLIGTTSSLQGAIANSADLVFAQLDSIGIFVGTISGAGNVTVNSPGGGVNFNTNQTYTGSTIIQAGNLSVNAELASSNVLIQPNGILSGIGLFVGNVINSGVLSPGNSPGTITMNGNYTQDSTGTLLIEIASSSSFDQVVVGGSAQLDGTLQVVLLEEFQPDNSESFTILTASGGVTGTFSTLDLPADFPLQVVYDPTDVRLVFSETPLIPLFPATPRSPLIPLIPLFPATHPRVVLEKFTPRIASYIKDILFNTTNAQYGQLTTRLAAIRSGVNDVTLQGIGYDPMVEQYSKRALATEKQKIIYADNQLHWDIWAAASGVFSRINSIGDLPSINAVSGWFGVGADYRVDQVFDVGVYAGYQGNRGRYSNGWLRNNGVKWGLYGTAQWEGFYVNGIVGGGANIVEVKHFAKVENHHRNTRGHPFVGELDSLLGAGYEYRWSNWIFGINNSIQYTYLGISAFTQTGVENLNVRVGSQNPSSLVYSLGGNISYLLEISPNYRILPTVGMYWQHEFLNYGQRIGSNFVNGMGVGPVYFNSWSAARNNAFGVAGITAQIGPRLGAFAYYTPQFGGNRIYSNAVLVGANFSF